MGYRWKNATFYIDSNGVKKHTRLYNTWNNLKSRCNSTANAQYKDYGGRGIHLCEEWANSFDVFCEWAYSNGYSDELTIDREDNNKGYSPDNCRWVDRVTQNNNRRNNVYIGELTMAEYAREHNMDYGLVKHRVKDNVQIDAPKLKNPRVCEGMTLQEISERYSINLSTLANRWGKGYRNLEDLTKPLDNRGSYKRG